MRVSSPESAGRYTAFRSAHVPSRPGGVEDGVIFTRVPSALSWATAFRHRPARCAAPGRRYALELLNRAGTPLTVRAKWSPSRRRWQVHQPGPHQCQRALRPATATWGVTASAEGHAVAYRTRGARLQRGMRATKQKRPIADW